MPLYEGQVRAARLITLEQLVGSQPQRWWSSQELAHILGVTDDTIVKDLTELSRNGRLPLVDNGKATAGRRWRVDGDAQRQLPPLRLDYAQGAALYAALRLLSQQYDDRNDPVRNALIQLIGVLPAPLQAPLEAIAAQLPRASVHHDISGAFTALSQGWLLRRVVRLRYEPAHGRAYSCQFAPYLLEPSGIGYTLYFIGQSDPPDALRTYKLERVVQAELTDEPFTVPETFDGAQLLQRAWGVMSGDGDPVHIRLRFSQFVGKRVRETRWHPSQRADETAEGLIWEADIGDVTEIRPWIRGWGADCEVLEPADLREEMSREARRLTRLYHLPDAPQAAAEGASQAPDPSLLADLFGKE